MATKPSFELRLRVLNAVYEAPGNTMRQRIKFVAAKSFADVLHGTRSTNLPGAPSAPGYTATSAAASPP